MVILDHTTYVLRSVKDWVQIKTLNARQAQGTASCKLLQDTSRQLIHIPKLMICYLWRRAVWVLSSRLHEECCDKLLLGRIQAVVCVALLGFFDLAASCTCVPHNFYEHKKHCQGHFNHKFYQLLVTATEAKVFTSHMACWCQLPLQSELLRPGSFHVHSIEA